MFYFDASVAQGSERPQTLRETIVSNRSRRSTYAIATNERAIGVYEACGFRREAVLPERSFNDGAWVDHVVMSVTRDRHATARESSGAD